jgi:kynurenine formamidase
MRIFHDLTRPIVPDMPVYPGDPPVEFSPAATLEADGFRVTQLRFGTHTGTHLDAPAHFLADRVGAEALSLSQLIGPAHVVDLVDLQVGMEIEPGTRLLVRSGWSGRWTERDYFEAFPSLPDWFVEEVASAPAALLGLETPSLHPDHEIDAKYHRRLLGTGVVIVENLVGLESLPARVELAVLPLPFSGLDGSPCRAVAWFERDADPS